MKKHQIKNAYLIDKRLFLMAKDLSDYFKGNTSCITSLNEDLDSYEVHISLDEKLSELLDIFNDSVGDNYPFDGGDLEYFKEVLASVEDQGYSFFLLKSEE